MIPDFRDTTGQPTVLIATADNGMRNNLSELLQTFSVRARWARGVEEEEDIVRAMKDHFGLARLAMPTRQRFEVAVGCSDPEA